MADEVQSVARWHYVIFHDSMGLYSIPIRDTKAATKIPAILQQYGYDVRFKSENGEASFYTCCGKRRELTFWITKRAPQQFSTGVGREGTALVHILDEHGIFEKWDGSGRPSADNQVPQ